MLARMACSGGGSWHTLGQPEGAPAGGRHLSHCLLGGWAPAGQEQKCGCFLPGGGLSIRARPPPAPLPRTSTSTCSQPDPWSPRQHFKTPAWAGKARLGTGGLRGAPSDPLRTQCLRGTQNGATPHWTSAGPPPGVKTASGPQLEPAHTLRLASRCLGELVTINPQEQMISRKILEYPSLPGKASALRAWPSPHWP